jgi:membrane protein insertase Oxa1/YidC/SpoIIIJ
MYQPLFNIMIGFYWLTEVFGLASMGIAVILLALAVRGLLLPVSLASDRSEAERRKISQAVSDLHREYASQPVLLEQKKKKLLRQNKRVLLGEMFTLIIQVIVALMLWRMFRTGLTGQDVHLIYSFMPHPSEPYNLVFQGKYDLTQPSLLFNTIQAVLLFVLETVTFYTSPYKVARKDVVRMQLVLPLISFVLFIKMPAGKLLFIIITLLISITLTIVKAISRKRHQRKLAQTDQSSAAVVATS